MFYVAAAVRHVLQHGAAADQRRRRRRAGARLVELAVAALAGVADRHARAAPAARRRVGALIVVGLLANTGLPRAAAGRGALLGLRRPVAPAIAYDSARQRPMFYIGSFAVGAAFGTEGGRDARRARRARSSPRNPPLIAAIAGLLAPDALAPDVVVDAAHVVVYALLVSVLRARRDAGRRGRGGRAALPAAADAAGRRRDRAAAGRRAGAAAGAGGADHRPCPTPTCSRRRCRRASTRSSSRTSTGSTCAFAAGAIAWTTWSRSPVAARRVCHRCAMRALVQRVSRASVRVDGERGRARSAPGLLVLLGVDARRRRGARRPAGRQGARAADLRGRRRPDERAARRPRGAVRLAVHALRRRAQGQPPVLRRRRAGPSRRSRSTSASATRLGAQRGVFGAHMEVELVNDGPVTLLLEVP